MKRTSPKLQLTANINVEQWRQEIQTFVEATLDELRSIQSELSSGKAEVNDSNARNRKLENQNRPNDAALRMESQLFRQDVLNSQTILAAGNSRRSKPANGSPADDRLFALKQQLAERINSAKSYDP